MSSVTTLLVLSFIYYVFFFKQKTAYEMRISDWSSDVCSSDLESHLPFQKSGRERDRETHQFKEDLDRKFEGEIAHKLAFAARAHRFAIFAGVIGNLLFQLSHSLRREHRIYPFTIQPMHGRVRFSRERTPAFPDQLGERRKGIGRASGREREGK